jgi:hypothetical protein
MENTESKLDYVSFEPSRSNRFFIELDGIDIPAYLFRKYRLFNVGEDLIFITEIFDTVNHTLNPSNLFNVVGATIKHLDPTGVMVNGLKFEVKGVNFIQKGNYSSDDLLTTQLRLVVKEGTMHKLFKDIVENGNG